MRVTAEEELSYIYQLGLDFCAKVSLRDPSELEKLRGRFKQAAAAHDEDDSLALRLLDRVCEVYQIAA